MVLVAFVPTLRPVIDIASSPRGPDTAWLETLRWMRDNTPEPFGDPSAYFARYPQPAAGEVFAPPPQAYGVMAWWDYGYWILRIGRRVPVANPTQAGAGTAARFFTATNEASAVRILEETGARYVVANYDLAVWLYPEGGIYGL